METGDQAWLLEAEEIREKVHLVSLRIVQEERSIRAKLATEEGSVIELEKLVCVQLENLDKLQLLIQTMKKGVHLEETHEAQVEELSRIYVGTFQQLHDSMTSVSSDLNMALQEKEKLTEVFISRQQEINQLQERKREQELLHTKHIEQLHQQLKEEQALAAREASGLEEAKKAKARLQKKCEEDLQQESARLEVGRKLLLASSEQCCQLSKVHSKLTRELTVSNADIASLAKLNEHTEMQNREQLASSTEKLETQTTVLQEINEELQEAQLKLAQQQQEEATALQQIQVLESEIQVSSSELGQLRARDMELKVALEEEERATCNLKVSVMMENTALEQLMEGHCAEVEELQKKKDILVSQLQQERSSYTLDLESHSSQVEELKNELQQKQQDLLTVQESLHVQQEESRKTEKKAEVNRQKIIQLKSQVLCMQAERLAAQKVTADLSDDNTNLDEKRATLEVGLAKASKLLMEQRGMLTKETIQLQKERAQLAELEHWHIQIKREQDEANRCQAHTREKEREAHKARIESLTREFEDWETSQVASEEQTLITLELKLQFKIKELRELKARLLHIHRKKVLFHIQQENSEAKLLQHKRKLENELERLELSLPVTATSTPLEPLASQVMPHIDLIPSYKDILKPEDQALNTPVLCVSDSDVSSSPISQEFYRHNVKTKVPPMYSMPLGPKVAVSGRRNCGSEQENAAAATTYLKYGHRDQVKRKKLLVPASTTSSPLVSLNSQEMPQSGLVPFYKDILKPKGQALKTPIQHVYESDVSSSPLKYISRNIQSRGGLVEPASRVLAVPETHRGPTKLSAPPGNHSGIIQQVYPGTKKSRLASEPRGGSP